MIFDLGIIILIVLNSVQAEDNDEKGHGGWSYEGANGPENWGKEYKDCDGQSQSPIKLEESTETKMERFILTGYDTDRSNVTLVNNGHTVQLLLAENDKNPACIEGGGLSAKYCFAQLHFHWGLTDENGPEHIHKQGEVMEGHFVNTNPDEERSIAVLGVFFIIGSSSNNDNNEFKPITDALKDVTYNGQKTVLKEIIQLKSLLPKNVEDTPFYRYDGSLTTPPCSETVIWTVFDTALEISGNQIEAYRNLRSTVEDETPETKMAPNFRPPQALNGRTVSKISEFN